MRGTVAFRPKAQAIQKFRSVQPWTMDFGERSRCLATSNWDAGCSFRWHKGDVGRLCELLVASPNEVHGDIGDARTHAGGLNGRSVVCT